MSVYSVDQLMTEARRLAAEYRRATGRPLAIGGEIAKHDAMRLLDLAPPSDPQAGCDAVGRGRRAGVRYQVKGRAIFDEERGGQRIGQIKAAQSWDRILLVLMDAEFEPFEIHEATRAAIMDVYPRAAQARRAKRGPLSVARFKAIGRLVWSSDLGATDDGCWPDRAAHDERG